MAKYTVLMSCGHTQTVELFGKNIERENKIRYYKENGLCKECYKEWIEEKNKKIGLLFHTSVLQEIDNNDGSILVKIWFSDNTAPYKEKIKSIGGYKWIQQEDFHKMCWEKIIKFEELSREMEYAKDIGAICMNNIHDLVTSYNYEYAMKQQRKVKKVFDEIKKIEKPIEPNVLKELRKHKWNETIYGKAGNYVVYLDGQKTQISDNSVKAITNYKNRWKEYKNNVLKVKGELL